MVWQFNKKMPIYEEWAIRRMEPAGNLILNFQLSELWEINFYCLKAIQFVEFVIAANTDETPNNPTAIYRINFFLVHVLIILRFWLQYL
jgi:hypothetical protein